MYAEVRYNILFKQKEGGIFFMSVTELMKKIEASSKKRTSAERIVLLKKAHIIDSKGRYDAKYFSSTTVSKDKTAF